ncbi:hypothetical protein C7999DRAFT_35039 [Corynascus novoguineensis]|uniref:Period circadian protein n=1 Tax=Corynascus novoguineensis TaxID=1126955 RepID=A0AAN7CP07_9PEZI|nr:hypothetical protein C7999DRAFT_35039 [Corynascus novoguineensis]
MPGIMNKIKEAVHPDLKSHHKTAPEGSHGPHSSRAANAADPRVDSDRDNSRTVGTGAGRTAGHGEYGSTGYGTGAAGYGTGTAEGTHGPHGSRVANAADPRVDSDLDNSHTVGTGTGRTAGHGEYGSAGYGTGTAEGTHGPHSSRVANAADPRVDSDLDNSRTLGSGTGTGRTAGTTTGATAFGAGTTGGYGSGTTGGYGSGAGSGATGMTGTHGAPAGTHGPHSSRIANAADPRVDSDRDGRGALGTGPGPASNTAGPHSSDMANKMDPRVDSDLDGSRTVGGNKTYQSGTMSNAHRDPTDAAQVPPSVLKKHVGGPSIEHEDTTHHRERRHSIKTHQETFRGI